MKCNELCSASFARWFAFHIHMYIIQFIYYFEFAEIFSIHNLSIDLYIPIVNIHLNSSAHKSPRAHSTQIDRFSLIQYYVVFNRAISNAVIFIIYPNFYRRQFSVSCDLLKYRLKSISLFLQVIYAR